jgi:hypothetical protein
MTRLNLSGPRRRGRRLWLGLIAVILILSMYGFSWWLFVFKPRWDELRPFVGTWRLVSPSPVFPSRPELVNEMDLRFDGTIIARVWDPKTGTVDFNQPSPARWRLWNGRYQEVWVEGDRLENILLRFGVSGDAKGKLVEDALVTWEGPDRFSLQRRSAKYPTVTWSRCESPTDLPRTHIPIGPK